MCVSRETEAGQQSDTCGASPGNVKAPGPVSASVWEERAETALGTLKPLSFLVVCLTARCCEKQAPCGFPAGHLRGRLRDGGGGRREPVPGCEARSPPHPSPDRPALSVCLTYNATRGRGDGVLMPGRKSDKAFRHGSKWFIQIFCK